MSSTAFVLSKLLSEFIYPFNLALALLLAGWLLVRARRLRTARWCLAGAFLLLFAPGTGYVEYLLMGELERTYPSRKASEYPAAEVIVVLGGSVGVLEKPRCESEEIHGARLQMAARLFKAGKAPRIIVSGGGYRRSDGTIRAEAEDMRDLLVAFGVPASAITMESGSLNTFENAVYTANLLADKPDARVLLVTSAFHLPRAAALFRKQGVHVEPVACSFLTGGRPGLWAGLKPDPGRYSRTETAIKEHVGYWVYWLWGKI